MNKKILIGLLALIFICYASVCFASNNGSTMQNFANNTDSALENIGNSMRNVTTDVRDGVQGAADSIGNGVQDMFDGDDNNDDGQTMMSWSDTGTTGGYTATRTGTDAGDGGAGAGMSDTAWVWLILGITGVVIVALTWYYVTQDTSHKR